MAKQDKTTKQRGRRKATFVAQLYHGGEWHDVDLGRRPASTDEAIRLVRAAGEPGDFRIIAVTASFSCRVETKIVATIVTALTPNTVAKPDQEGREA